MEFNEFNDEMRRIESMFGEKHYSNERKEMIWRRVRGFSKKRFRAVCDEIIGSCRTFPVVKDFDEAATRAREADWAAEKRDFSDSYKKIFSEDEVQELFKFLRDKLDGKISEFEFKERMAILERSVELAGG